MLQTVTHPNIAVVYDALTGALRRKIVPGPKESPQFNVDAGEGFLIMRHPPFDDAACFKAVAAIVGKSGSRQLNAPPKTLTNPNL